MLQTALDQLQIYAVGFGTSRPPHQFLETSLVVSQVSRAHGAQEPPIVFAFTSLHLHHKNADGMNHAPFGLWVRQRQCLGLYMNKTWRFKSTLWCCR